MSEIDSDDYDIVSTPELSEDEAEKEVDKVSSLTDKLVSSSSLSAALVAPSFSVFDRFHSPNDGGKEFLSRSANLRYTSLPSSEEDDIMKAEIHSETNSSKDDDSSSLVQSELELPPQRPNTPSANLLGVAEGGKADEILNRMIQSLDDYSQESLNMEPTYSTVLESDSGEGKKLETDFHESGRAETESTNAMSNEVPSMPIGSTELKKDVKGPHCSPTRIWFLHSDYRLYNIVSFVQLVLAFLIVASATTFLYQYSKPFILTSHGDRSTSVISKPPTPMIVVTPPSVPSVPSVVSAKRKKKHRATKRPKTFNTVGLNRDGAVKSDSSVQVVESSTEVVDLRISETSTDPQPTSLDQHDNGAESTNVTSKPESSRLLISEAESDPFINNLISVINFTSKLVSSTSTSVQAIISSLPSRSASNMAHLHMQILNQSSLFMNLIIRQCESFTILLNETIERLHQFANGTIANVKSTSGTAFSFMESMLKDVKDATKIIQSKVSEAADILSESVVKSGRTVKTTITETTLSLPSNLPTLSLQPLYNTYTPLYLQTLLESNSMQSWNRYSNEPIVLSTVLVQCGADVLRSNLNQVITVLQVALRSELNGTRSEEDKEKEKEWEVRLCLLNTLFQILYLFASSSSAPSHSTSTSPSSLSPHLLALLQNVFVPLATWKAGPHNTVTRLRCFQCLEVLFGCFEPTSFALSSSAVSLSLTSLSGLSVPPVPKLSFASSDKSEGNLTLNCLITTDSFEHEYEINGKKESLRKRFLKVLIGSIEDDEAITRVACLRVLKKWFELEIENGQASFDENHLKEVYPEVLSRLDDSLDAIRIQACRTLIGLLTYLKKNEEKLKLDDVHGKEITKMVVVHVDDTREDVANAACDVLATTSLVYPQIVKDYLNSVRVKYRNKGMIEKLVSEIVV